MLTCSSQASLFWLGMILCSHCIAQNQRRKSWVILLLQQQANTANAMSSHLLQQDSLSAHPWSLRPSTTTQWTCRASRINRCHSARGQFYPLIYSSRTLVVHRRNPSTALKTSMPLASKRCLCNAQGTEWRLAHNNACSNQTSQVRLATIVVVSLARSESAVKEICLLQLRQQDDQPLQQVCTYAQAHVQASWPLWSWFSTTICIVVHVL